VKYRPLSVTLGLGLLIAFAPQFASASGESITDLNISARLSPADSLDVTEQITYDFAGAAPHPLTHAIPVSYHDDQGLEYRLAFSLIDATVNGAAIASRASVTNETATMTLAAPAGSAVAVYKLHYTLSPVVLKGMTAGILKMNISGSAWDVPIQRTIAKLQTLGIHANDPTCSIASQGVTSSTCDISQSGDTATFVSTVPIQAGEVMSIASTFPSGSFSRYLVPYQAIPVWVSLGLIGLLLLLALVGLLSLAVRFWRRFRHPSAS
jgi:hypothetical protein